MSELVSSAQLAEMALPILPKSKQGIEHVAKRDGWPFEYIKGQGRGGRLKKFVLSGLTEEIQTAVRERQAEQLLAQSQPAVLPSVAKAKRPVAVRRMTDDENPNRHRNQGGRIGRGKRRQAGGRNRKGRTGGAKDEAGGRSQGGFGH